MRYVVLALMGILSVLISGTVFSAMNIGGLQIDLLLLVVVSVALIEKSSMPIILAAGSGLFMDILFSTTLGVYALSYTAVAAVVVFATKKARRQNPLIIFAAGAGGYLAKEIITGLVMYILGARFDFGMMLYRYILPSMLINGALVFVFYLLFEKLFKQNFMKLRKTYGEQGLDL